MAQSIHAAIVRGEQLTEAPGCSIDLSASRTLATIVSTGSLAKSRDVTTPKRTYTLSKHTGVCVVFVNVSM